MTAPEISYIRIKDHPRSRPGTPARKESEAGTALYVAIDRATGAELGHVWRDKYTPTWHGRRPDGSPASGSAPTRNDAGLSLYAMSRADRDARSAGVDDYPAEALAEARRRSDETMAIAAAEGIVTRTRIAELDEERKAARRRWSAAKGRVTRARNTGSAEEIAVAEMRRDIAKAEWEAAINAAVNELPKLGHASSRRFEDLIGAFDDEKQKRSAVLARGLNAESERPTPVEHPADLEAVATEDERSDLDDPT